MKILWLSNTPSLSLDLGKEIIEGGWIASLENSIVKEPDIFLAIAFFSKDKIDSFRRDKTTYYPICEGRDKLFYRFKLWWKSNYINQNDLKAILSIVRDFQPDLIHIHGTELGFGEIIRHLDVPVVMSIQGNLSVISKMYYRGIPWNDILRYIPIRKSPFKIIYWKDYFKYRKRSIHERKILIYSSYLIGRTDWDKRISRILAPQSIYFHNDEILRDCFYEHEWKEGTNLKGRIRLHTTISSPLYKGLETIVETASLLDSLNFEFEWYIAGLSRNDAIVVLCKNKYPGNYFERVLNFLGKLSSTNLLTAMLRADIYITASHIENSSNSLCEAMILGMPCIATFAGGTNTLLRTGIEGILIQDGDPYSLAGAIVELKENFASGVQMGLQARKRAMERHDRRKITRELLDIYTQIIRIDK